jgi:hypothetical protein
LPQHSKRGQTFAKRFAGWRRKRGVTRDRFTFDSFHNNVARALELAQVDRDLAAHVIGHVRSFPVASTIPTASTCGCCAMSSNASLILGCPQPRPEL